MEYIKLQDNIKKIYINQLINDLKLNGDEYNLKELNELYDKLANDNMITKEKTERKKLSIFDHGDNYIFKKEWTKLSSVHKIIKLKEYVKTKLGIIDKKYEKKLIKELIKAIKNKLLTKKKSVIYDFTKEQIISIPQLKFIENKYLLDI